MYENNWRWLVDLLLKEDLEYLILYGSYLSSTVPNDVDLLAICKNKSQIWENCHIGEIDLIKISSSEFRRLFKLLDPPLCTEPLLTGRLLYGNERKFKELKEQLLSLPRTQEVISYLSRRSLVEYMNSLSLLKNDMLLDSLIGLSFSVSYYMFGQWYQLGGTPIPLADLLQKVSEPFILDLFRSIHTYKKMKAISFEKIKRMFMTWEIFLVSSKKCFENSTL